MFHSLSLRLPLKSLKQKFGEISEAMLLPSRKRQRMAK
jgi:hypothetical protein